ncbi:AGE family epimerase/isomerase [Fulvivirga maritima]|uniref:AGE family epimerase/isomerase n=1 Tax=Fulvivirga maritima TaxID=2904247 RepID=UPI001F45DB49|nr:AGE family epimerase/isomerase [Fulvivirga maritima]UII25316.1 AGE family epimerase/isomerase [Fulvivirga maritima]
MMNGAEMLFWLKKAKPEFEAEMHRSLQFWIRRMQDPVNGGFYGRIDGLNQLYPKADKSVILNTRILWTFSHIARYTSNKNYHEMALRAYDYIIKHFIDKNFGGVYWMVDYKGEPVNKRKQVYAQAFAIYALSEYYLCSKDEKSLQYAKDIFRHIEHYSFDAIKNGYMEAFTEEWEEIDDLRLSEKDANEKKTMNTHLHVMEAYTNLYRVWPDEELQRQLRNLLLVFFDKFINSRAHFQLFFDENWNRKSAEISFGHDIEGSWLLCEAAEVLDDKIFIEKARAIAIKMTDAVIKEGLDSDGALMNEADEHGITDSDKHWWPQAEALVGFMNAWEIKPEPKYVDALKNNWQFINKTLLDQENGEWYWRSNKIGTIITSEDKAGPWKCPYHNNRAMMELIRRIDHFK